VLVLSMYAAAGCAMRALRDGAAGYLSKNASPEELLETLRRVAGDHPLIGGSRRFSTGRVDIEDPVKSIPEPGADFRVAFAVVAAPYEG